MTQTDRDSILSAISASSQKQKQGICAANDFFPSRFMESAIHCTETLHFNSPLEADLHIF